MIKRSILLLLIVSFSNKGYNQTLSKSTIVKDINNMSVSNDAKYDIIYISNTINNLCIVGINPPYREFPNILLYNYNKVSKEWKRVFECLSIGIQPEPSGLLDLHTSISALDFIISKDSIVKLNSVVKKLIKEAANDNSITIPYQYFLHSHSSPSIKSFYTIDKTNYFDLANTLFDNKYNNFPKEECTMFDTPNIYKIGFQCNNDTYEISAVTSNNQLWHIKFKGIDSENQYLLDKKIEIKKISE